MSWKPEVIADGSGKWCGNALRFATYQEAYDSAVSLSMRWFAVRETRAVESDDPVNYQRANGVDTPIIPSGAAMEVDEDNQTP